MDDKDKIDLDVTGNGMIGRAAQHRGTDQVRRGSRDRRLERAIGLEVRALRRQQGYRIADLSAVTGVSVSMLSKIENGATSASLSTLQSLSKALSVPLSDLFRRYDAHDAHDPQAAATVHDSDRDGTDDAHA